MNINDLLVSNLNISEDNYEYKAIFTLSYDGKVLDLDLASLDDNAIITEIRNKFELSEDSDAIKNVITSKVIDKSSISSLIKQGEDYHLGDSCPGCRNLDRA